MEKVNYITHLNAIFEMFNNDERIRQGHITLYLALFQKWNRKFFKKFILFLFVTSIFACSSDDEVGQSNSDNFDRQAMLANWADHIIIPAYENLATKTETLKIAGSDFRNAPNSANLDNLKNAWQTAYVSWQNAAMFEIGKAEELRLQNNLNIYPTNVEGLTDNVMTETYNLELPSEISTQGFPALDYLLFGIQQDETAIMQFYQADANAGKYLQYIVDLTTRIDELVDVVLADWKGDYRTTFVENRGNSANASVDKMVNDYIFYYEKHLRAGKIGIPAGVFSGDVLSDRVEAFYKKDISKMLFMEGLDAVQNFFNGADFNGQNTGESMASYLEYLDVQKGDVGLKDYINQQFDAARTTALKLNDNFVEQVETDNVKMLETYDQLQLNVVNLKVDMLQAFNINVDFVDADGD